MNLALIGVSPSELLSAASYKKNTETSEENVLPDEHKVAELKAAALKGRSELESISSTSTQFQQELQQLAQEMKQLETQSTSLYQQLEVRNKALAGVEPMVQARVVPPAIVQEICFGEIGPQWRAALIFVSNHCKNHDSELSKKLLLKASTRIKDYYVSKVRRLRRPGIDAQTVQTDLINNSSLFEYLSKNHPEIATTVKQAYISTIKWFYQMLLEKYLRWIGRQPTIPTDKSSTIGESIFAAKSFFSFRDSASASSNTFNVGARPTILSRETTAMAWGTPAPPNGFHGEILVHSLIHALQDTLEIEDKVIREAFNEQESVLEDIFSASLAHAGQILDKLFQTWDVFDLLLSLKILQTSTGPPIYETFKQNQIEKIWVNIERVLEENSKSIESAIARPSATRKIGPEPHALTITIASMLTGVLQLAGSAEPILATIRQFLGVYEMVATKLSKCSDAPELFLYNNYFLISSLLGDLEGTVASELSKHFQMLTEVYSPT